MSDRRHTIGIRRGFETVTTFDNVCNAGSTTTKGGIIDTSNVTEGGLGQDRPNWRALVAARREAGNTWSADYYRVITGGGSADAQRQQLQFDSPCGNWMYDSSSGASGFLGLRTLPSPPTAMPADVRNAAIASFISKARRQMSPFQGGVFLGELRETLRMIRSPAKALFQDLTLRYPARVTKRVRAIKQRRASRSEKSRAAIRTISGSWLEAQFGWRPLISDISSGAEALARLLNYSAPYVHVSASFSRDEPITTGASSGNISGGNDTSWNYTYSEKREYSIRYYGAFSQRSMGSASSAQHLASLRWSDVLPTVWELIPYSFLVDYFSNVGSIIDAATFCSSDFAYVGATGKMTRIVSSDGIKGVGASPPIVARRASSSKTELSSTRLFRDVSPTLVPTFQFKCPGVGSQKWFNIAALGGVRVRGGTLRSWF